MKDIKDIKRIIEEDITKVPYKDYDIGKNLIDWLPTAGFNIVQFVRCMNKKFVILYIVIFAILFLNTANELNSIDKKYLDNKSEHVDTIPVPKISRVILRDDSGITTEFDFNGLINGIIRIERVENAEHNIEINLLAR